VDLGAEHQLPVMEDLGSGTFIDFSRYGLLKEPTVQASVSAGVDIITFSGDKLLGGPQAGLIIGKKVYVDRVKRNPITRALRIDKLTLAALESTLRLYRDERKAVQMIPTLRMMLLPITVLEETAARLQKMLADTAPDRLRTEVLNIVSRPGGGSLPLLELPSKGLGVRIEGLSANTIERRLRRHSPPLIGRIEDDTYIMDMRTLQEDDPVIICRAFEALLQ
jgi:L-seryl-tRNA(Ser) seleniumtransferase